MITHDYIPRPDAKLTVWAQNYKKKLPTYADTLGLTADEVTASSTGCDNVVDAIVGEALAKQTMLNTTKAKEDVKNTEITALRAQAKLIKANPAYTEAMGEDLGIIGVDTDFDNATAQPTLSVTNDGGTPVISFDKQQSNGVRLYCQRTGETTFTFLALDTHSPYHDTRPNITPGQPETRQYYAYYTDIHDLQHGQQSAVVSITL
jgi:hypothetical protein